MIRTGMHRTGLQINGMVRAGVQRAGTHMDGARRSMPLVHGRPSSQTTHQKTSSGSHVTLMLRTGSFCWTGIM